MLGGFAIIVLIAILWSSRPYTSAIFCSLMDIKLEMPQFVGLYLSVANTSGHPERSISSETKTVYENPPEPERENRASVEKSASESPGKADDVGGQHSI